MSTLIVLVFWVLNFGISWLNAWGCGKTWNETKSNGGMPHFLNWMGAVMSASGFTWCYMLVLALVGTMVKVGGQEGQPGHPILTPEMFEAFCNLGYLVILLPILGSGLAITIHSWGVAWRRRRLGDVGLAGYNTFAQIYNFGSALRYAPEAGRGVSKFFDSKDLKKETLVILLVVVTVAGGILTTWLIVKSTAKATALARGRQYVMTGG